MLGLCLVSSGYLFVPASVFTAHSNAKSVSVRSSVMLVISGEQLPLDVLPTHLLDLVLSSAPLKAAAACFLGSAVRRIPAHHKCLVALQGEQALYRYGMLELASHDAASSGRIADASTSTGVGSTAHLSEPSTGEDRVFAGSEDATTCVIAVLRCPTTKAVWAAHFDDATIGDTKSIAAAVDQMAQPELYLVGGYDEPSGSGRRACQALLHAFHALLPQQVALKLAVLAAACIDAAGGPATRQLAVDCATGVHPHGFRLSAAYLFRCQEVVL